MGRAGIEYEQVATAATVITGRGETPTVGTIRKELGGTGSFTTISNHLKT